MSLRGLKLLAALIGGCIAAEPRSTSDCIVVSNQTQSIPVPYSFVSYSIEYYFFPDFAGNKSQPNEFSYNLLNNIGNLTGTKPIVRVGGNTQDYAIYNSSLPSATYGVYNPARSTDYPTTVQFGPAFFESYTTWPGLRFTHGFNLGKNGSAARAALLESVPVACRTLQEDDRLLFWEYGNEPDLYKTSSQGPVRPPSWNEQDYVDEWLNGTRAIEAAVRRACPSLGTAARYQYLAPSFAGTDNSLNPIVTWHDGLDSDRDITVISSHNYIGGATQPGVTLQHTLMNHSSTVASIAPQLNESRLLAGYGLPYILGETNSLYNEGAPGLSNSFGAALWGFDFNLYCASQNISRVHMHQGTDYRYAAWQPVQTNKTTKGTKPPYYGQIAAAAALGNLSQPGWPVRVSELPLEYPTDAAYAIHQGARLARVVAVNLREYNYSVEATNASRGTKRYTFQLPLEFANGVARLQRLSANGSNVITGVTFDGYSYNYELDNGRPVLLHNVTRGETARIDKDGMVDVAVPDSSGLVLSLQ